jgi:hypothetical protein
MGGLEKDVLYGITSGNSKSNVQLSEISRNLKPSSEVYSISDKEVYLGVISRQTLVLFATEFADYALQNYAKKDFPEAETCIRLTRKWLEDRESVSDEELWAAANAAAAHAAAATYAAAYAAYAAAAYAAAVASAASAAAYAAAVASAASAAADAAADAAGVAREKELLRQGTFILDFLKNGKHLFSM